MTNVSHGGPPTAVILNLHYTGLGIARSLKGRGIPVIGLMGSPRQCGWLSRFCRARTSPSARTHPQALLPYLLDLAAEVGTGAILLPTSDADVLFITQHREALSAHFVFPLPETDVVDMLMDKAKLYRKALECDVPAPRTILCDNLAALRAAAGVISYPVVVKPVVSLLWHHPTNASIVGGSKAIKVWSPEALEKTYRQVSRANHTVLVQEFVPGGDEQLFIAGLYFSRNGEPAGGFTARKWCQVPQETGTGVVVESVVNPEILSLATRLLRHLGFRGVAEVEFKQHPATGIYHLIEINPRFWDWHRLGAVCGINLCVMAYQDLTGHEISPMTRQKEGTYWVAGKGLLRHLAAALLKRRNPASLSVLWRLVPAAKEYAIFAWDDPLPALFPAWRW
ncbi:MAG TPA: hypothetical protein VNN22_11510 [Verrucomicrobiae bacterium]|nr:hypothetical protein [Verrucomicrobiae bacterium]